MKLILELTLEATDERLVHPRVAGALIDYAAAVIRNNQAMMQAQGIKAEAPKLAGDPPVGFGAGGKITTAHEVTITEHSIDHEMRKSMAVVSS